MTRPSTDPTVHTNQPIAVVDSPAPVDTPDVNNVVASPVIPTLTAHAGLPFNRRSQFVSEYCASVYLKDGATLAEIAVRAGYSPNGASVHATRTLQDPRIQASIKAKMARITTKTEWTLERSARVAVEEFERLRETRPEVAFRYKTNLDQLHGLLIERTVAEVHTIDDTKLRSMRDEALREAEQALQTLTETLGEQSLEAVETAREADNNIMPIIGHANES